ncbi:MAG: hypothetical protein AAFU49_13280 [Pseudomonadota bacterium]
MTARAAVLTVFSLLIAVPALAERNLVPNLNNAPDVCADRPAEPDWMQNIPLRESYKRVLVQDIYRAQNLERIAETGICDCDTRFPSWDAAEAVFFDRFANAERWEMLEASDVFNRRASAVRSEAMAICEAVSNW